ncbi:unnamed protein product [Parnassius mnemosyne]|uniref:HTH psq-type domain-containing protein n=1 Tax=Parnassius mnemosyne TaxID=213953 RepID=A0AAV1M1B7_9NEOP
MVKNYKRKTERGNWSEQCMKNTVDVVSEEKMGYKLAAKTFSVPQTTLERKVKKARAAPEDPAAPTTLVKVPLGQKSEHFLMMKRKNFAII